jgi:TonB family protein
MEAGPFTARPVRRFRLGIGEAVLVSLALHLLLLFWMAFGGAADLLLVPLRPAAVALGREKGPSSLQFTFVDLPEDREVAENPRARLLSDKTREARQNVPTPPDATLSPDPHSVGNSPERRAGSVAPPQAARRVPPTPARPTGESRPSSRPGEGGKPDGTEDPFPETNPKEDEGPEESNRSEAAGGRGGDHDAEDRREAFQKALRQLESGTYDFSGFDNPAYLQGNNYGTLSFDTKGFDWGDYARQLYLIIKKNWYDRIPIAAYYGQKGKVFIRFVIEKDGSITDLAVIRSSEISPFDRAAENAIRASNPLPPLPSNFPKTSEGVTFGFYYNLPIDGR